MQSKLYRHGYELAAVLLVLFTSPANSAAQAPNPAIQPYVGHWAGEGWG